MSQKVYLKWNDVEKDTLALLKRVQDFPVDRIVAITRGGLFPALILSQALNVRDVYSVAIKSYEGEVQKELQLLTPIDDIPDERGTLIVDDLVDSGNTMKFLRQKMRNAWAVTPYAKPAGLEFVTFTTELFKQDQWLVFPWEQGSIYDENVDTQVHF